MSRFLNADALASTGQGLLGNNMFGYCLNSPVVCIDETGAAAKICISADGSIDDALWREYSPGSGSAQRGKKLSADDFVLQCSTITKHYVDYGGTPYTTFFVSIHVNCFLGDDGKTIEQRVMAYTSALHRHINSLKEEGISYYTMSQQHIYSEIMAHVWVWIHLGHPSTEVINLNVNESRPHVIFLMERFGYNGEEEFE